MTVIGKMRSTCVYAGPLFAGLLVGLPMVTAMTHGFDPATWPSGALQPTVWWHLIMAGDISGVVGHYVDLMSGTVPAFPGGGRAQFAGLLTACAITPIVRFLTSKTRSPENRDVSGQLGDARWANSKEKSAMTHGLEVGIDPDTGQLIRVALESNALTVAPPRAGKTAGQIIPNLLAADADSWIGPIVVIDPKGDVFAATSKRRLQLGRKVVRFDLRRAVKRGHQWNPLAGVALDDTERLIAMARVLVVEGGTQNAYFSDRAVDLLAGTMAAELLDAYGSGRQPTMQNVAQLLSKPDDLLAIAQTGESQILRSLCGDLRLDERSRDQLISTAKTSVSWLHDERFGGITARSTFSMEDVVRGKIDLFIIVSPASIKLLAPLLRLMLADLMARALTDRRAGDDRLLILIDEAAALGKFSELEQAVALLPGLGVSFWTFWQSMSQLKNYETSQIFIDTAELLIVSDFSSFGKDAEDFSRALGNYTAFVEGTSAQQSASGKSSSKNQVKQAVPLMTAEALRNLRSDEMIVLLNSKRYSRRPLRLRKIKYFEEARFASLYGDVRPTTAL